MTRLTMTVATIVLLTLFAGGHAWGGLFNRFSNDMLANLGYGRTPYKHYPYGQVEPDEVYAEALESNRIDDVVDEPVHCYSSPCATNGDCCRGLSCLETEDGGRCLPAFGGRKMGEMCNRENQCDAGLVCEEVVPGEMHVCRPPSTGRKQYSEDCNVSSECDITRGLCCIMQRRHRQKARKSCGYFKEPLVCIGPVATDQVREMHVCRPPSTGRKQYSEDCNVSSECDITRGLCCIMQRRHRQKARKSCGYFKEPLVCIGPVATDQVREFVQHTNGEKRIGVYRLH